MRCNMNSLLSLTSGATVGAAIMYLFDPDKGQERREYLGETTGQALHESADTLGSAWTTVSERTTDAARALAGRARDIGEDFAARGGDVADDLNARARQSGRRLMKRAGGFLDSAREMTPSFLRHHQEESSLPTIAAVAASGLSCLAIGAGVMYFFDPERGYQRRRMVSRKINETVSDVGRLARATGEHLGTRSMTSRFRGDRESDLSGEGWTGGRTPNAGVASNFRDAEVTRVTATEFCVTEPGAPGTESMPASVPSSGESSSASGSV